jgi:hypothetical protein
MFEVELASRGGAPLSQPFHILKALWHLSETPRIGRKELSMKLGIGEGSARKLLAHLESFDCATSSKQHGIVLTAYGVEKIESLGLVAAGVDAGSLTVGAVDFGVRLTGLAGKVAHGVEQRDEAIKAGADGATTLVMFRDELRLPDGFDVEGAEPEISAMLKATFSLAEDDALFIGTARTAESAEDGAFAAAVWTLKK